MRNMETVTSKKAALIFLFAHVSLVLCQLVNKTLSFNSDRTFTILHLTDLHYGENTEKDESNIKITNSLIAMAKPDIVVVTGDAVSGFAYYGQQNFYKNTWTKFTNPFVETGTLYAYTIGNHDDQGDYGREQIAALDVSNPYSLMKPSEGIHGISNYYLPVHSYDSENVSAVLWMFDSGDEGCSSSVEGWGCVQEDQILWYNESSWELKREYGNNTHGIAFMHIPPHQFMDLFNEGAFYGDRHEQVSCPVHDSYVIDAMLKNNDVSAVFVGHDHDNAFGGWWNEIELVFGRKTGYGGYGPSVPGIGRGARVIVLKENVDPESGAVWNVTREHWILYENGTIDSNKTLRTRETLSRQWFCNIPTENVLPIYVYALEFALCLGFIAMWLSSAVNIFGLLKSKIEVKRGFDEQIDEAVELEMRKSSGDSTNSH